MMLCIFEDLFANLNPMPQVSSNRSSRRSQGGSVVGGVGSNDCRHGESSGYESVIRDSECSSFGSSQDSGLDDGVIVPGPTKSR